MSNRYEGLSVRPQALFVSPEAPYPPMGGGALRTSSLIDYFARRFNIDVVTFREHPKEQRLFPPDRVRDVLTLDLPVHSKSLPARAARNLRRYLSARPPLVDRYSGFDAPIADWLGSKVYPLAVVEHFWCAPYAEVLRERVERLVLDLHNIESRLQETAAGGETGLMASMFRRFAAAYTDLEREWIPRFDDILVASHEDARRVRELAPQARITVYPNAIARQDQPQVNEETAVAFSGNLAYHANLTAIRWFATRVWPAVRRAHPQLEWRVIGKNPEAVPVKAPGMRMVGPVEDAVRELAGATIVVVPLLSGSGTRFKILEAWAAGRAVVSTSLGAEGLGARPGEHLLIADDEIAFGAAIETLLTDPGFRQNLGSAGRRLYLDRFTVEHAWRALDSEF